MKNIDLKGLKVDLKHYTLVVRGHKQEKLEDRPQKLKVRSQALNN